ncbi:hypothetical protein HHK36_029145 [Tetracentron sinense]|uniref:Uncharacterized protein n=1 Tax=Tetracentron sinense TaxID=13715 RepID=A0A834YCR5_TETSI|nr:hypothetical protein HHK36_029145 [Tetracentron sinense]
MGLHAIITVNVGLDSFYVEHWKRVGDQIELTNVEGLKLNLSLLGESDQHCREYMGLLRLWLLAWSVCFCAVHHIGPGQQVRMMLDPVCVYATAIYIGCAILALICALLSPALKSVMDRNVQQLSTSEQWVHEPHHMDIGGIAVMGSIEVATVEASMGLERDRRAMAQQRSTIEMIAAAKVVLIMIVCVQGGWQ